MICLNVDSEQLQTEWLCEKYVFIFLIWLSVFDITILTYQHVDSAPVRASSKNGVKGMTAILDVIAGLSLAAQLQSSPAMEGRFLSNSMPVAVAETRQGMYKEYTVERVDDKALDEIKRGYKTAEETDDSKNKVK